MAVLAGERAVSTSPHLHATCCVTVFSRPRSMTAVLTARNELDPRAFMAVSQYRCALYSSAVSLMRRYGMWGGGRWVPFAFYSRHRSVIAPNLHNADVYQTQNKAVSFSNFPYQSTVYLGDLWNWKKRPSNGRCSLFNNKHIYMSQISEACSQLLSALSLFFSAN